MDVKIEEDLDIQQVVIPSMVVQIPVENALKHGLAGIDGLKFLVYLFAEREVESLLIFAIMDVDILHKLYHLHVEQEQG